MQRRARRSTQPLGGAGMQLRQIIAVVLAWFSGPILACTSFPLTEQTLDDFLPARFERADSVVRGRVLSLKVEESREVATIEVLRTYKGADVSRIEVISLPTLCGYEFKVGEERVYFIKDHRVRMPDVAPPSSWLLSALDKRMVLNAPPNTSLERTRER
jgi:hypothetical protein